MMKKLFLFTLLVASFLVISCSNGPTNPTNGSTTKPTTEEYKANGISSIYANSSYKFFSMDGETYAITIKDGAITGLQQGTVKVDLTKADIYSKNLEGDAVGNIPRVYLIYNNELKGSLMIKNNRIGVNIIKNDGTQIEGIIAEDLPESSKIPQTLYGPWEGTQTATGEKITLNIDAKLVSMIYKDLDIKIPNLFFESTQQNTYEVIGYSYTGTSMVLDENGAGTLTIHFKKNEITKIDPVIQDGKVTGAQDNSHSGGVITLPVLSKK
ncbi:hypothetical secreted protein [Brachyspira suanatina]|uniref:Hypothetical secreted protein n=1 Tax=Brachyspira suanatina TaxID=381802 RepID=A0A0G4K4U6_9SPIR|nr:hypothetical protein [Brachyspira suanatina]CRF31859.1 hypothetical secreted protein [Brachyspira suanatina]